MIFDFLASADFLHLKL